MPKPSALDDPIYSEGPSLAGMGAARTSTSTPPAVGPYRAEPREPR